MWVPCVLGCFIGLLAIDVVEASHERVVAAEDLPAYTLFNEAVQLQGQHRDVEALQAYQAAVDLKPDLCEAYLNAGTIVHRMGSVDQARVLYEEAFRTADMPRLRSNALNNLAHLRYTEAGSDFSTLRETVADYQRAIGFDETNVDAWYNMGKSLEDLGLKEEARQAFLKVLELDDTHPSAHLSMGNYYLIKGDGMEALAHHRQVLNSTRAGSKDVRSALNNMGQMFRTKHMYAEAKEAFQRSVELDPDDSMAWSNLMVAKRSLCEWDGLEDLQERIMMRLRQDLGNPSVWPKGGQRTLTPYDSTLLSSLSPSLQLNLTRAYLAGLQHISHCKTSPPPTSPLRLTYLSYDFRDHPMGHLTQGIVTSHSKGRFLVQAASYGPTDNSTYRQRIASGVDSFVDLEGTGEVEAACDAIAHRFQPHIVIDLMGLTRGTRTGLTALRPAPLIVNYLGYPGTMGSTFTDYILVDRVIAPVEAASASFSERLALLPYTYQANDYSTSLPLAMPLIYNDSSHSRDPKPRLTLCNFNHVDKLEPTSFSVWMSILRSLPSSHLHLLRPSDPLGASVTTSLQQEAASHGVHPSRIVFLPRVPKDEHVARLATCDLFLDTLTYGAHSTASDALFAGVPLLTLQGWGGRDSLGMFPSRVGASLLRGLGRAETIATGLKDFEDLARRLGGAERGGADQLRAGISAAIGASLLQTPVFSVPVMTRALERGYQAMWEVHHLGLPPRHLIIAEEPGGPSSTRAEAEDSALALLLTHLQDKRASSALHVADRLVASSPLHADAWHLRGLALMQLGRLPEAVSSIDRAVDISRDVSFYYQNRAEVLILMGRRAQAQRELYHSLRLAPTEMTAALRLQSLLHESQANDEALLVYERLEPILSRIRPPDPEVSRFYQQHAIGLAATGQYVEAVRVLQRAVRLFPRDHQAAMRLGSALEGAGLGEEAASQYMHAVRLKNEIEYEDVRRSAPTTTTTTSRQGEGLPRVVIYCDEYGQSWWGDWGPSSLGKGLGGSEEAVVFMARELVRSGRYRVEVYGSPPREEWGRDEYGVEWWPCRAFSTTTQEPPEIFVAWRYHISLALATRSRLRYLWLQDLPSTLTYTPSLFHNVHHIFCLSSFHANHLPSHLRHLAVVTPNGIDPAFLVDGPNLPHRFVYGSAPNRGLEPLLRLWPQIRSRIRRPEAPELLVYYGFSEAFLHYGRRTMANFTAWLDDMHTLLRQDGVRYIGMVDHARLAEGYASAGFMLYPTTFPETGCVTLMKAMAMGAVPITSRYPGSTLPELTGSYDLGPRPIAQGKEWWEDDEWRELYVEAVVAAANDEEGTVGAHRREMVTWARERFLWVHVAGLWMDSFDRGSKERGAKNGATVAIAVSAPP